MPWPIPDSIQEALKWWDDGLPLMSVEMGGVGPSYEQCIQIVVMELLREITTVSWEEFQEQAKRIIDRLDRTLKLSEAQSGVATQLAYLFLTKGFQVVIEEQKDRQIMVGSFFPAIPDRSQ